MKYLANLILLVVVFFTFTAISQHTNFNTQRNWSLNKKEILSERENTVLQLLADGLLYKEIADRLNIVHGTVRQHIHNIYEKLHVTNRTEAVNKYFDRN